MPITTWAACTEEGSGFVVLSGACPHAPDCKHHIKSEIVGSESDGDTESETSASLADTASGTALQTGSYSLGTAT